MTCPDCGGQRTADHCNLCELFREGAVFGAVEQCRTNKPRISRAVRVAPKDIPAREEFLRKKGIRCEHTPDGRAVFESDRHQAKVIHALGMFNRNGGYAGQ